VLNLKLYGDVSTTGNNPVQFTSTTGRLQAGLQFEAPLTRMLERNAYRLALIDYQQARRSFYALEDRISQSLRNTLRQIQLDQLNFEIRRAAVYLAIVQVDTTRLRLIRPPKPGETQMLGATTSRDLVDALAQLLSSENDILNVWIDYEAQRLYLDLDMGTMQLDRCGQWIDPGPIEGDGAPSAAKGAEELPAPEPLLDSLDGKRPCPIDPPLAPMPGK
jgi:outer membrane protein TolC